MITKVTELQGKAMDLIEFKLWKTKAGITLTAKSPALREWFYGQRDREHPYIDVPRWGFRIFRLPDAEIPFVADVDFMRAGESLLMDQITNLSWLRAENLHEGITITQTGAVLNSYLYNLREGVNRGVAEFYREYMKPFEVETLISTITRERE